MSRFGDLYDCSSRSKRFKRLEQLERFEPALPLLVQNRRGHFFLPCDNLAEEKNINDSRCRFSR